MMIRSPLLLELLEDRTTPATYGVPWLDPTHLTLSFAADGTPIAGHHSELLTFLDARLPRAVWQQEFVRAFQTWAEYANLSIGLHPELISAPEYAFGIAGRLQGDARFGDIRVGGQAMSDEVLSISAPPDPYLAGTLGGDIFLNITADINAANLFPILLHETGHVLGLDHNDDPKSPMYAHLNHRTALTPGDIVNLQALYGARGPDQNERCAGGVCQGNETPNRSTTISYSHIEPRYWGDTPLVVYGDVTTFGDIDYFILQSIDKYTGPVTFWLQTNGISPAMLRLTVQQGTSQGGGTVTSTLGRVQTTHTLGDLVTFTIPSVTSLRNTRYFARIESDQEDLFGIGRYALGVTFDQRVEPRYLARLDEVMRGRYDALRSDADRDIDLVFRAPNEVLFAIDGHTNDEPVAGVATLLPALPSMRENSRYEVLASIEDDADVDYYLVTSPEATAGQTVLLTATLLQADLHGALPYVFILDANGEFLLDGLDVLLDGNGTFVVQVPNLAPETPYFLGVWPRDVGQQGNYLLTVDFGERAAELQTFTMPGDFLDEGRPQAEYALYVGRSQLFQMVLNAGDLFLSQPGLIRMQLFDATGTEVYTVTAGAGGAASAQSVFLVPGAYRAVFTAEGYGEPPPAMSYRLRGVNLTDPIGPVLGDSLLQPQYVCEDDPALYCYPGEVPSLIPFLWAFTS